MSGCTHGSSSCKPSARWLCSLSINIRYMLLFWSYGFQQLRKNYFSRKYQSVPFVFNLDLVSFAPAFNIISYFSLISLMVLFLSFVLLLFIVSSLKWFLTQSFLRLGFPPSPPWPYLYVMLENPGTALASPSWLSLMSMPTTSLKCGARSRVFWPVPHPRSTASSCGGPFCGCKTNAVSRSQPSPQLRSWNAKKSPFRTNLFVQVLNDKVCEPCWRAETVLLVDRSVFLPFKKSVCHWAFFFLLSLDCCQLWYLWPLQSCFAWWPKFDRISVCLNFLNFFTGHTFLLSLFPDT